MMTKPLARVLSFALSLALAFMLMPAVAPGAQQQAEAETTINTFDDLRAFLGGGGGSATLGEDINLGDGINVVGNPELNLNGKSINVSTRAIYVDNNRTLTLKGSGTINCQVVILESTHSRPCGILKADDSVVFTSRVSNNGGTLDGGTYNATCANYNCGVIRGGTFNSEVTVSSNKANGEIAGGTFSDGSRISNQTLRGGTFYGSIDSSCDVQASAKRSVAFMSGGKAVGEDSVIRGQKTTAPADPSRNATAEYTYAFDGWYTDAEGGQKATTFGPILEDTTYYAHWRETRRSYTVTWDLEGGSADMSHATGRAAYGTEIAPPASPRQPEKVFEGWWTAKTGGEPLHPDDTVTGDVTYHARWRDAVDVSTVSVAEIPDQTYTGADIKPALTVKDGDTTLEAGTDYEASYKNNRTVGTAAVVIVGKGFYKGKVEASFAIVPKTVRVTGVSAKSKSYDGTDDAELDVSKARIEGAVSGDDLGLSVAGHFDGSEAGAGKKVVVALALHGNDVGNYRLEAVELELSADIEKADPALSVEAVEDKAFGDKRFQLQVAHRGDATVSFKSTDENVLKVSDTGEVEIVGVGTGGIEVSVPETANYLGASRTLKITVGQASGKIEVEGAELDKVYGDGDFSIVPTGTTGGELNYASDNATVAKVDPEGIVHIVAAGKANITVSMAETATHEAATETIALQVAPRPVELAWGTPTSFEHDGETHSVTANVTNVVNGDKVGLEFRDNVASEPGTYEAAATAVDNKNYTLEGGKGLVCEWSIRGLELPPAPQEHDISVPASSGQGTVSIDATRAAEGSVVSFTVKAEPGYELASLRVVGEGGAYIAHADEGNGAYSFRMPAGAVKVEAVFEKKTREPQPGRDPQPQPEPKPDPQPTPEPEPSPEPAPEPQPVPGPKQETGTLTSLVHSQAGFDGKATVVSWSRVKDASGYRVYLAKCGSKGKLVRGGNLVATVKSGTTVKRTFKKLRNGRKLSPSAAYKLQVRPYKVIAGKEVALPAAPTVYLVSGKNGTYANAKKVTVSSKSAVLSVGKVKTFKAKVSKTGGKKLFSKSGVNKIRWFSSNPGVATVSSKGKVTAKKKGTCTVYAIALNGKRAGVRVQVR